MNRLQAYLLGIKEFRRDITSGFDEENGEGSDLQDAYEAGRIFAHQVTLGLLHPNPDLGVEDA